MAIGSIDTERGWGRAGETWTVKEELAGYDADPDWFGLGDRDHLRRLFAGQDVEVGDQRIRDRNREGNGHAVREAPECGLNQLGDRRLTEEPDTDRSECDPILPGGHVPQ